MTNDIGIIFRAWLLIEFVQWVSWPILTRLFKKSVDYGWATGKILITLIISLVVWFLAHLGIPVNTNDFVLSMLVIVTAGGLLKRKIRVKVNLKLLFIEELLFTFGFWFQAIIRGFNPNILDLEKFMDFGFIKQYLMVNTLPATDMWLAGEKINYYSFGHFWASIVIRLWQVPETIGYNLILALILGLSLSLCFSIIVNQTRGTNVVGGIVGALLVSLGGNGHVIWQLISKRTLDGYWYADATRFIYHTIHEFPGYSFVVSDLHGHLLDLPIVLFFIFVLGLWTKNKYKKLIVLMGILLGVMAMTNSWDVPIYGLLLAISWLCLWVKKKISLKETVHQGALLLLVALLTTLPWIVNFKPITGGVNLVALRSPVNQLAVLWLVYILIAVVSILLSKGREEIVMPMAVVAVILVIMPELVYVKDIYLDHPRANTMFKLTYQAFVLFSLVSGWLISKIASLKKTVIKFISLFLLSIWSLGLMVYPYNAYMNYYGSFKNYLGIDGFNWVKEQKIETAEIIDFMKKNRNGKNIVEAVGDSYTSYDIVSVFSGVPTILGWRVHEWLWRGGYEEVGKRDAEVKEIYEGDVVETSKNILKKYNVGWIVLGENEYLKYGVNFNKLLSLGEAVWKKNGSQIIKVY